MQTEIESRKPTRGCEHCRMNPQATKPFLKMHKLPIENDFLTKLKETAKAENKKPDCFACELLQDMIDGLKLADRD